MKRSLIRVTACTLALVTTSAFSADTFPRLAAYDIASPQDYWTSAHVKQLSTVQIAVLSYWPGWGKGAGVTMNDTVKKIKALNPNTKVFLYERPESQQIPAQANFGDLYNKITNEGCGGLIEHFLGRTYSVETSAGWGEMMKMYRKVMATLAAPKYGVCSVEGSKTDYQFVRYGLASCLMDDGYFAFSDPSAYYRGVPWFDEYSVKLGNAMSGPSTSAWQSGVYRRNFQNGILLVNPKGNGTRTVTLETNYVKIRGTQAPSVNNGATVRTVTLKDRDGIILLRQGVNAQAETSAEECRR